MLGIAGWKYQVKIYAYHFSTGELPSIILKKMSGKYKVFGATGRETDSTSQLGEPGFIEERS